MGEYRRILGDSSICRGFYFTWLPMIRPQIEATAPVKLPTWHCPSPGSRAWVRDPTHAERYFKVGSTGTGVPASQPPAYPTQHMSSPNTKM